MPLHEIILLFVFGAFGGFLGGLLGVGGAMIFVPILTHYLRELGVDDHETVRAVLANSLLAIIVTGIIASQRQIRDRNFYWKQVVWTALPAICTSLLITWIISMGDWYSKKRFIIFFIIMLGLLGLKMFWSKKPEKFTAINEVSPSKFFLIGALAGIISALSGLGAGGIMVPAMTIFMSLELRKSISVSSGVMPFFALPMTVFYALATPEYPATIHHMGYIIPSLIMPLLAGVILTPGLGVRLAKRLSETQIRVIMGVFLFIVTIKMITELF